MAVELFSRDELIGYLFRALGELSVRAAVGCEKAIPGSYLDCGVCAACSANALIGEIKAEEEKRRPAWKFGRTNRENA